MATTGDWSSNAEASAAKRRVEYLIEEIRNLYPSAQKYLLELDEAICGFGCACVTEGAELHGQAVAAVLQCSTPWYEVVEC